MFMNTFEIDDLLELMVLEDIQHFSPHYICDHLNIIDIEGVSNYLLTLVNKKLIVHYEIECPDGHSDIEVLDPTNLPKEPRECICCGTQYIPNAEDIWVAFDFTAPYIEYVKKKAETAASTNIHPNLERNTNTSNKISLEFTKRLPAFQEKKTLYESYRPDREKLNGLLQNSRNLLATYNNQLAQRKAGKSPTTSVTTKQVGDSLENLATYIFSCTNDILVPKGSWANDMSQFDDILLVTCDQCFLVKWPPYAIVECKNWGKPLSKQGVNDLIAKLRDSRQHVGIIFSRRGVTGDADYKDAKGKIAIAASHGNVVIVVDDQDLDDLGLGKNLFDLLEQRYFECQMSSG